RGARILARMLRIARQSILSCRQTPRLCEWILGDRYSRCPDSPGVLEISQLHYDSVVAVCCRLERNYRAIVRNPKQTSAVVRPLVGTRELQMRLRLLPPVRIAREVVD